MTRNTLEMTVETLEDRRMMAGNVTVDVSDNGNVSIVGDDADNQIRILPGTGALHFYSRGGTTINGQLATDDDAVLVPYQAENLRDIKITMKDGNDSVNIREGHQFRNLTVKTGAGNDRIDFTTSSLTGNARIILGDGTPDAGSEYQVSLDQGVFLLGSTIEGNVKVKGDDTHDTFNISSDVGGRLQADLGDGDDELNISSDVGGRLQVKLGDGDDAVDIRDRPELAGRSTFKLGDGDDRMSVRAEVLAAFKVDGGDGLDTFYDTFARYSIDPILVNIVEV